MYNKNNYIKFESRGKLKVYNNYCTKCSDYFFNYDLVLMLVLQLLFMTFILGHI